MGPQEAEIVTRTLNLRDYVISRCLKSLLRKEIVNQITENEVIFSALPFERTTNTLVKLHLETRSIEQNRNDFLSQWNSLVKKDTAK